MSSSFFETVHIADQTGHFASSAIIKLYRPMYIVVVVMVAVVVMASTTACERIISVKNPLRAHIFL